MQLRTRQELLQRPPETATGPGLVATLGGRGDETLVDVRDIRHDPRLEQSAYPCLVEEVERTLAPAVQIEDQQFGRRRVQLFVEGGGGYEAQLGAGHGRRCFEPPDAQQVRIDDEDVQTGLHRGKLNRG